MRRVLMEKELTVKELTERGLTERGLTLKRRGQSKSQMKASGRFLKVRRA